MCLETAARTRSFPETMEHFVPNRELQIEKSDILNRPNLNDADAHALSTLACAHLLSTKFDPVWTEPVWSLAEQVMWAFVWFLVKMPILNLLIPHLERESLNWSYPPSATLEGHWRWHATSHTELNNDATTRSIQSGRHLRFWQVDENSQVHPVLSSKIQPPTASSSWCRGCMNMLSKFHSIHNWSE